MSLPQFPELTQSIGQQLAPFRKSQSKTMQGFSAMALSAMADGALSEKHKEFIALAIGISQGCHGCIGYHVKALVRLGATKAELEEALGVAVYMGGGPALMHTADALAAWEQFQPTSVTA